MDDESPREKIAHSGVYRETFLAMLEREEAHAFRLQGLMLENRFLDREAFEKTPVSFTETELRGAFADLRFLAEFLRGVGKEREASELPPRDWQLANLAEEIARDLGTLVVRLEGELGRLVGDAGGVTLTDYER